MKYLITLLLSLTLVGCSTAEPVSQSIKIPTEISETAVTPELENTAAGIIHHPHSLPALRNTKLAGRDFALGNALERTSAYTRYAISYTSEDDLYMSGIMNIPNGEGPYPLAVLAHGYIDPRMYTTGRGLRREQDHLARAGYAVIHPDYRGHATSDADPQTPYTGGRRMGYTGYTADVMNAIVALRAADLPQVDASRVGILGHSMGGGIAMNIAAIRPDLVDAVALYAPVSSDYTDNFLRWSRARITDTDRAYLVAELGDTNESTAWETFSARTYFRDIGDLIALYHGTSDDSCPLPWSHETRDILTELGKDITYIEYANEEHEFIPRWTDFIGHVTQHFDTHVK